MKYFGLSYTIFYFHGIFKKNEIELVKRTPTHVIHMSPLSRNPGSAPEISPSICLWSVGEKATHDNSETSWNILIFFSNTLILIRSRYWACKNPRNQVPRPFQAYLLNYLKYIHKTPYVVTIRRKNVSQISRSTLAGLDHGSN